MGVVYKARDPKIDRLVAIKVIAPGEGLDPTELEQRRDRFQREARAAGRLTHPNIVTIHDVGEETGRAYLVMELIEGEPLDHLLRTRRPLPLDQVLSIADQVASALDYAHANSIIHRDIKPANILLTTDGVAKVTDFGIARIVGTETTQTGKISGTPSYMSPEHFSGLKLDGRSDIFSFGAVLYELVSGDQAFPGETISNVMYRIINEDPVPLRRLNPGLPPGLDACLRKALAKDAARRYAKAADLARDLRRAALGRPLPTDSQAPATVKMPSRREVRPRASRRRPLWPWILLGGGILTGLVLVLGPRMRAREAPPVVSTPPPVSQPAEDEAAKAKAVAEEAARQKAAEEEAQRKAEAERLAAEQRKLEEEKARLAKQQAALEAERKKAAEQMTTRKAAEQETPRIPAGTVQRRGEDNAEMVYIPAGTFTMGDTHGDGLPNEKPPHQVSVQAFWIDRTEVTFAQITRAARAGGARPRLERLKELRGRDQYPATHITWRDAATYCHIVGKRLPTEAEWEYAAGGTDGRRYPWGETWESDRARFEGSGGGQGPAPVGSYPSGASPLGVLDMAGNVWEWVSSLEKPYPYVATDGREDPATAGSRVIRGGAWKFKPRALRTTSRHSADPTTRAPIIGFRCARSHIPPAEPVA
jgi:serine/threonine-protein kinase